MDAPVDPAELRVRGGPLLAALDRRLHGARDHADATAAYVFGTAAEVGMTEERAKLTAEAARLHDLGKLYLPAELLRDSPPLDAEERLRFEYHPEACYRLLLGSGVVDEVATWLRDQCERVDGHGFPRALPAEEIPLESRVIAAACAYDEGRRRMAAPLALAELRGAAGSALDPAVVAALAAVVGRAAPAP